jgi:hypothetical protein
MLKQQIDIDIDVHLNYLVEMNIFMYIMFTKFRIMHKIRSLTLAEVSQATSCPASAETMVGLVTHNLTIFVVRVQS